MEKEFIVRRPLINVPDDQPTIQDGIEAAIEGDTVLVADGIYSGDGFRDIIFNGKNIVLKSENGSQFTTIDCQGTESEPHRAFKLTHNESQESQINGFTIINGYAPDDGIRGEVVAEIRTIA